MAVIMTSHVVVPPRHAAASAASPTCPTMRVSTTPMAMSPNSTRNTWTPCSASLSPSSLRDMSTILAIRPFFPRNTGSSGVSIVPSDPPVVEARTAVGARPWGGHPTRGTRLLRWHPAAATKLGTPASVSRSRSDVRGYRGGDRPVAPSRPPLAGDSDGSFTPGAAHASAPMTNELSRGFRYPVNEFRNFHIAVRASSTPPSSSPVRGSEHI